MGGLKTKPALQFRMKPFPFFLPLLLLLCARFTHAAPMLQGGDISQLHYLESLGTKFYERGKEKDLMQILADNGFNFVRLRAYNDPGNPNFSPSKKMPPGFQTTKDILALAKRAAAKGMKIQLTLNYSDWWADGCLQDVPHEWIGMTVPQIRKALHDYTYGIVSNLVAQGTPPEMVSLGNQMQCGLLLKPGEYGKIQNWPDLVGLLNEGHRAVKAASPSSKVMLHIDSPAKAKWFFDGAVKHGAKFDVMGVSWYPHWEKVQGNAKTDTLPELLTILNEITQRYDKDVFILETGVNWTPFRHDGTKGQLKDNGNVSYPETPEGQRDFLRDLMSVIKRVEKGRCLGFTYWDPISVNQPGFGWIVGGKNEVENYTLFDYSHNALPGLTEAFKNNR